MRRRPHQEEYKDGSQTSGQVCATSGRLAELTKAPDTPEQGERAGIGEVSEHWIRTRRGMRVWTKRRVGTMRSRS